MSDILDDLKMLADHCDQENGDEPCDLGMLLIRAIGEIRKLRSQPVSAAEVPMPEVHDYGYELHGEGWVEVLACNEADVRTYGDAREAAGYARGRAEAEETRRLYNELLYQVETKNPGETRHETALIYIRMAEKYLKSQCAALRGEVK